MRVFAPRFLARERTRRTRYSYHKDFFKAGWFPSHLWHGSLRLYKIAHALLIYCSLCSLAEIQKGREICLWEQFIWFCAWKMSQLLLTWVLRFGIPGIAIHVCHEHFINRNQILKQIFLVHNFSF